MRLNPSDCTAIGEAVNIADSDCQNFLLDLNECIIQSEGIIALFKAITSACAAKVEVLR